MEKQMMKIKCLQDVVIHQTRTDEDGEVWIETYCAFYAGEEYQGIVSINPLNEKEFSVIAKNERGLNHQLKDILDSGIWFGNNFMFVRNN